MSYLSMEGDENEDVSNFRKKIRDEGISEEALEMIPHWLGFERDMLKHLLGNLMTMLERSGNYQTTCNS